MPGFPSVALAPQLTGQATTNKFVDFAGRERSSRFEAPADATVVQLQAVRDALGDASNAALIASEIINFTEIQNPSGAGVVAFDDAYGSVGDVAVMIFINNNGDVRALEVPAPDASLFSTADYETVDVTAGGLGAAIVTAALAALNAGTPAGTFVYSRGFYSKRKTKRIASRTKPGTFREPDVGESPPDEPGV